MPARRAAGPVGRLGVLRHPEGLLPGAGGLGREGATGGADVRPRRSVLAPAGQRAVQVQVRAGGGPQRDYGDTGEAVAGAGQFDE